MKLSENTLAVLKNFATINGNIVFRDGSKTIKTIAEAKNVMASATIEENLPAGTFGIYDLAEFLSVMGMFESPEVSFSEDLKYAVVKQGKQSVKYYFSDISILTSPTKDINFPTADVEIKFTESLLNSVRRASSTLGLNDLVVESKYAETGVTMKLTDLNDATSNTYEIDLEGVTADADVEYSFIFNVSNLKLVQGDYDVKLSSKLISEFKHATLPIQYYIAIEKQSSFESK